MARRRHRYEVAYPVLWRAVDGALREAMNAHPEIEIPNRASVVKRVVGQVLAPEVRAAIAAETQLVHHNHRCDGRDVRASKAGSNINSRPTIREGKR